MSNNFERFGESLAEPPNLSEDAVMPDEVRDHVGQVPQDPELWLDVEWYDLHDIHRIKELKGIFSTYTHKTFRLNFRHMRSRRQPAMGAGRPQVRWYIDKTGMTKVMANLEAIRGGTEQLTPVDPPLRLADGARHLMDYPGSFQFHDHKYLNAAALIDMVWREGSREEKLLYLEPDFDPI